MKAENDIEVTPKIICLTGGIGSGKSFISDLLNELTGYPVIDSDLTAKVRVMQQGCEGYKKIVEYFGDEVLLPGGDLDTKKISKRIFQNRDELRALNAIVHPLTVDVIKKMIADYGKKGRPVVFLESAIPFGADYTKFCDEFWFIHSSAEDRIKRLMESRGYSYEKCQNFIRLQMSDEEFYEKCDRVIENPDDRSFEDTMAYLKDFLEKNL